ncbi:hypothetical protein, partial [Corallococcus praedator]|uniref:hypothetical protein n=1 Tax=Corallococcus praedator TaxID=2316724 RepID=UPI001ABEF74E
LEVAAAVNQSDRPLILSDASIERVLSLSYLLKPSVEFQLVKAVLPQLPIDRDLFLYQPSPRLRRQLSRQFKAQLQAIAGESWKVTLRKAQ